MYKNIYFKRRHETFTNILLTKKKIDYWSKLFFNFVYKGIFIDNNKIQLKKKIIHIWDLGILHQFSDYKQHKICISKNILPKLNRMLNRNEPFSLSKIQEKI